MLKKERLKRGYTQEKLSELTSVDPRTIVRIEKNLTVPRGGTYARIVIALEMTNEEIGEHIRKIAISNDE